MRAVTVRAHAYTVTTCYLFANHMQVVALVKQVFPTALLGFPLCSVVWTWDSLYYGAEDYVYNAKTIAFASAVGASGILGSLKFGWGLSGLWISMVSTTLHIEYTMSHYLRCCFLQQLHTSDVCALLHSCMNEDAMLIQAHMTTHTHVITALHDAHVHRSLSRRQH
jgi:hypothetical protein